MRYLSTLLIFCFISTISFAQTYTDSLVNFYDEYSGKNTQINSIETGTVAKSKVQGLDPIDQIWDQTPWQDSQVNFTPSGHFMNLGDINGDGFTDLGKKATVPDERDNNLSTMVTKTLIHYGGSNLSTEHDEIYYFSILPVGDINGDGFADAIGETEELIFLRGSSNGYVETSLFTHLEEVHEHLQNAPFSIMDVNGDEIDDLVGNLLTEDFPFFEILGNSNLGEIKVEIYQIEVNNGDDFKSFSSFSKNDTVYHTILRKSQIELNEVLEFYRVDRRNKKIVLADTLDFSGTPFGIIKNAYVKDFTGDRNPDLLYRSSGNPSLEATTSLFFLESDLTNERIFNTTRNNLSSRSEDPLIFDNDLFYPIGDLLGNGEENVLVIGETNYSIARIESPGNGFVFRKEIIGNSEDIFDGSTFNKIYPERSRDFKNLISGFNSFLITLQSGDELFGHFIMEIDPDFVSPYLNRKTKLLQYEEKDYSVKERYEVTLLQDLENDGVDNFAVFEITSGKRRILIYNGFNDETPREIEVPLNFNPLTITSGNFNTAEEKIIGIIFRPNSIALEDQGINYFISLYTNSDLETPLLEIDAEEIIGSGATRRSQITTLTNLGDVNNDGLEDLGIGAPLSTRDIFYIILGKQTLSSDVDIAIDYSVLPNGTGVLGVGGTVKGDIDINGDGIDDFIVSDYFRDISSNTNFNLHNGVLYIHYGQDTGFPNFSTPDIELQADTSESNVLQYAFGFSEVAVGDFDGDGIKDIAAKAFRHQNSGGPDTREGRPAIHYFFGKDGFSNQPDTLIGIRNENITNVVNPFGGVYAAQIGRASMYGTPDLTGDGYDELLLVPTRDYINAVLYEGGTTLNEEPISIFRSPNSNFSLNPGGPFINKHYNAIVGDFTGDGVLNFIGYQPADRNYRDTPLYLYDLENTVVSNEADGFDETPTTFVLEQNYPNPFNPSTTIKYSIGESGPVTLSIYNVMGQKITELVNIHQLKGTYEIIWDASAQASGLYFYRLKTENQIRTKQMTLIK